jgi:hypothetical protein
MPDSIVNGPPIAKMRGAAFPDSAAASAPPQQLLGHYDHFPGGLVILHIPVGRTDVVQTKDTVDVGTIDAGLGADEIGRSSHDSYTSIPSTRGNVTFGECPCRLLNSDRFKPAPLTLSCSSGAGSSSCEY